MSIASYVVCSIWLFPAFLFNMFQSAGLEMTVRQSSEVGLEILQPTLSSKGRPWAKQGMHSICRHEDPQWRYERSR